jgi:hypothetical protein
MPMSELFAWAASPMAVGSVAALGVTLLCYARFKSLTLDDKPADVEAPTATQGKPAEVTR